MAGLFEHFMVSCPDFSFVSIIDWTKDDNVNPLDSHEPPFVEVKKGSHFLYPFLQSLGYDFAWFSRFFHQLCLPRKTQNLEGYTAASDWRPSWSITKWPVGLVDTPLTIDSWIQDSLLPRGQVWSDWTFIREAKH